MNNDIMENYLYVTAWLKEDEEYCLAGEGICNIEYKQSQLYPRETLRANKNGFLRKISISTGVCDNIAEKLFEIVDDNNVYNKSILEEDKFTKRVNIKWERVGSNKHKDKRLNGFLFTKTQNDERVFFTINNLGGSDYIVINYPKKDFEIKKGDKFYILLENNEVINLTFMQNSYSVYECIDDSLKKINENKVPITNNDLHNLSNFKVINWKFSFQSGQEISGLIPFLPYLHSYKSFEKLQIMIQLLTNEYLKRIESLEYYTPRDSKESNLKASKEPCFLYLMLDSTNNYYKIGISNKPEYRERTLQSEKPTIELVAFKEFPNRKIAESFEKALHNAYREKTFEVNGFN